MKFKLQPTVTKAASASGDILSLSGQEKFTEIIATLDVESAERDSSDETYDIYVTTGDGVSWWDVIHFPQILSTGAKRYTARVFTQCRPENVTTATPGVAANDPATLATVTAGSGNGIKTLAAGSVRHGPVGDRFSSELVVAGTVATGIKYSITLSLR